ncbi:MAG: hypothetical protein JKY67_16575 [Pseudomonadales bacterium]|nr:hypothetical protein [Pseudomonadales bacterium]
MNDCCGSPKPRIKTPCPACAKEAATVQYQTVLHQLRSPLKLKADEREYYFCSSLTCDTAYFDKTGRSFNTDEIRGEIGQKSTSPDRMICYCFDISAFQIETEIRNHGASISKEKVIALTQAKLCACEIQNPSGLCCLAEFKKIEKQLK